MSPQDRLQRLAAAVPGVDEGARRRAKDRHARLLKPPGSLGRLEALGAQLAGIAGVSPPPPPSAPAVIVCAADHGVHARGVTAWPQQITATMVEAMCRGDAAVNALADVVGASVTVLDIGVAGGVADHPRLRRARVLDGTRDLTLQPAMTREEAVWAVLAGARVAEEAVSGGADLLVTGDMGIANTTASACLVAAFTGVTPQQVVGPGAGGDRAQLQRKRDAVATALALHRPDSGDPLGVLAAVGGLEHAALVGVLLAGAAERVPVVLDGVIADAAALVGAALCPALAGFLVAGHRSPEPGAAVALRALGLAPLLDLGLRLGEGTGALLAVPLVQAAAAALRDMGELPGSPTS